jgi:hypothetical protein
MNRLEEHIKKELGKRSIKPDDAVWERIESQLDGDTTQRVRPLYWMIAAAGLALLTVLTLIYRKPNQPESANFPLVERENTRQNQSIQELDQDQTPIPVAAPSKMAESENRPQIIAVVDTPEITELPLETVDTEIANSQMARTQSEPVTPIEIVLEQKIKEVWDEVALIEQAGFGSVSDAEIDSLLRAAEEEILAGRLVPPPERVSAETLLAEVEEELDRSFREQIFQKLKQGFFELRSAVAKSEQ